MREAGSGQHAAGRLMWLSAAVVVASLALRFWPAITLLDRVELRTLDWRFVHRGPRAPCPDVVILAEDDGSIAEPDLGRWPWRRDRFARVIRELKEAGARAIVFDIFFAEPDTSAEGDRADAELVAATRDAGNVYHAAFGHALGRSRAELYAADCRRSAVHDRIAGGHALSRTRQRQAPVEA